ncbi:hypothetical protein P3X46_031856 [Hevea brasiliensis]|uniref:RING-type E3 ubiquitin transferase n=1 Tax=Hevea brasiliensis TaxID=3981 RepID=A0ABQ9KLP6_HEVBR|nr:uncharacterized protein LOC110640073 [Hevea brasiliensis]KAJ9141308.1 hypothetical protein P3X46_031856 [Hevea brasiliensis]
MSTLFSSSLFEIPHPTHYRYRVSLSSPPENQDNDRFSRPAMITLIFHRFDIYQRYERSLNVRLSELPVPREQRFVHVPASDCGESAEGPECEIMAAMGIPPNVVNQVCSEVRRACSGTDASIFADIYIAQVHQQVVAYDDDANDDYVSDPLMEDVGTIPASKASIDGLTRLRFHQGSHDPGVTCVVCLEELEEDDDLIELPCSHLYHEDCIVKWLLSSHLCPLCRYQMPTEQPRLCPYCGTYAH